MNEKRTRSPIGYFIVGFVEMIISLYILSTSFFLVHYDRVYIATIVFAFFALGCVAGHFIVDIKGIQTKDGEVCYMFLCVLRSVFALLLVVFAAASTAVISFDHRSDEIVAILVPVFISVDMIIYFIHSAVRANEGCKSVGNETDDSGIPSPDLIRPNSSSGIIMSQNTPNEGNVSEETAPPLYASSPPSYVSSPLPYEDPAPPYPAETHLRV